MNTFPDQITLNTINMITSTCFYLFSKGLVLLILSMYELLVVFNNNPFVIKYNIYYSFGFIFSILKFLLNLLRAYTNIRVAFSFKMDNINNLIEKMNSMNIKSDKNVDLEDTFLYIMHAISIVLYIFNFNSGPFRNIFLIEIIKVISIYISNLLFTSHITIKYQYYLNQMEQ